MYSLITAATMGSDAAPAAGSAFTSFVWLPIMIVVFYFLLIRPQKKREKEAKSLMDSLTKGDKVVSIGGIYGTVAAVKDQTVIVKVDENTKIEFTKSAISTILNRQPAPKAPLFGRKPAENKTEDKKTEKVEKPAETKVETKAEATTETVAKPEKKAPAKKAPAKKTAAPKAE